jgi:hypothetical protein
MKSLTTSDKMGRYYLQSDVLFRTKESLIDFCETDDNFVAALTKVAFYILDKFSTQITLRILHSMMPQSSLFLVSNFNINEIPFAVIQNGNEIKIHDICSSGATVNLNLDVGIQLVKSIQHKKGTIALYMQGKQLLLYH